MVINGKRYILTDKRRFYSAIILFFLIVSLFCFGGKALGKSKIQNNVSLVRYTVSKGDTLWDIAQKYRGNTEIRKYIKFIMKSNGLDNANIYEGAEILIPVQKICKLD